MSVKGRTYPYRVVYQFPGQDKPGTIVIHGDRDTAERKAAEVQERGGSAQVVLAQGKTRTVVTEYPAVDTDLVGEETRLDPGHCVVEKRVSGRVVHGNIAREAHARAVQIQRTGYAAEVRRGRTVLWRYPALTGDALAAVGAPTTDERLDQARPSKPADDSNETVTLAEVIEQHERDLDARRLAELETEGPLSQQLRALAEEDDVPDDTCTTGVDHRYELVHEDDHVNQYRCTSPGCGAENYEDKAGEPVPAPVETSRPPVRVEMSAEWNGGDATEVVEYDRDTWDAMSVDQRRDMLDQEAADFMSNSGASYGYSVLGDDAGDIEKPAESAGADLLAAGRAWSDGVRTLNQAADDADDALGGELGRALALLLRHAGKHVTQGALDGMLALRVRRVAELVTERALAHREFSRGGPDRHDIERAARNAYSDRFEESDKLRRDHDAALTDAIDAVFDAVAQGGRRALMHPSQGQHVVAIRAKDGQHDEGHPWMTSQGGYCRDRDVTGWLELMPTGRVFDPARDES